VSIEKTKTTDDTASKIKESSRNKKEKLRKLKESLDKLDKQLEEERLRKEIEDFKKEYESVTNLKDIAEALKNAKETSCEAEETSPNEFIEEPSKEEIIYKTYIDDMGWKPKVHKYGTSAAFTDIDGNVTVKKVELPKFRASLPGKYKKCKIKTYRKCLAMLDTIKYDRTNHEDCASECCFPVTRISLLNLFGNAVEISRIIDRLTHMGILIPLRQDWVFVTETDGKNCKRTMCPHLFQTRARIYLLCYSNEVKFRKFCETSNLKPWTEKECRRKSIGRILEDIDKKDYSPDNLSKYVVNQKVHIKWDRKKETRRQFEERVKRNLLLNNPDFQRLVRDTEELNKLNGNDPYLRLSVEPHLRWSRNGKFIKAIGLRSTCPLASVPKKYKKGRNYTHGLPFRDRNDALRYLKLTKSDNDVKSSVPRIGHFLHTGEWLDQNIDCYKSMFDLAKDPSKPCDPFNNETWDLSTRNAMKSLFMSVNFSDSWKKANATTDWKLRKAGYHTSKNGSNDLDSMNVSGNDWLIKEKYFYYYGKAVEKFTGYSARSSSVFLTESCIYTRAALDLAKHGHKVFLCYDGFYTDKTLTASDFNSLIHDKAMEYLVENPQRFSFKASRSSTPKGGKANGNTVGKNSKRDKRGGATVTTDSNKLLPIETKHFTGCYNEDSDKPLKLTGRVVPIDIAELARMALESA